MEAAVDFLQLVDLGVGVDRRGVEVFVAEQLLDVADVGPGFEPGGGAEVAQMWPKRWQLPVRLRSALRIASPTLRPRTSGLKASL